MRLLCVAPLLATFIWVDPVTGPMVEKRPVIEGATSIANKLYPVEDFPDTCVRVEGNEDLVSFTVHEYPCRAYKTDMAGNKIK